MTEDANGRPPAADSPDASAAADEATDAAPDANATDAPGEAARPDAGARHAPGEGPRPDAGPAREPDADAAGRPGAGGAPRHGLIRPRVDRQIAGVCSGIGRATGTDPVLWRVLFAVGVLFGGAGLAAYLIGWLVLPEEGDTASPVEALFGRGRSGTSTLVTVLLGVSAVLLLAITVEWNPFVVLVVAGAGYLLYRQMRGEPLWPPRPMSSAPPSSAPPPPPARSTAPPPVPPSATMPGAAPVVSPAQARDVPPREETTTAAEAPTVVMPPPSPPRWNPPTAPPPAAPPPRPRREPSALGRVALFGGLVALGVTAALQLAGVPVGFSGYVAALLLTVGAALVLGAWIGRARWLIPVGALLAVTLAVSSAVEATSVRVDGNQVWSPSSTAEIHRSYHIDLGSGSLDLTQVDFTGQDVAIEVTVRAGNMEVILPPDVDVSGRVNVSYGNAQLLDEEISGARRHDRMFSDLGDDGQEGPGHVQLDLTVNGGNLEVQRWR